MPSAALQAICDQMGIEIIDTRVRRGPGQTCATQTMERILADYGEGHLTLVLRTIMESTNNRMELVAPTIWAVSDIILSHPAWPERGLAWLEAFDAIDLASLRETAKANRAAAQPRQAIATMLYERLAPVFGDGDKQGRLPL